MNGKSTYLVTLEARVRAEVAIEADSKREAARLALEAGPDSGELVGTPQRLTARVCAVREAGKWHGIE
jgi:hypothetical protein